MASAELVDLPRKKKAPPRKMDAAFKKKAAAFAAQLAGDFKKASPRGKEKREEFQLEVLSELGALLVEEGVSSSKTKAYARGVLAKRELLEAEGGSISSNEAAKSLQITRQAVDDRRKKNRLLAWQMSERKWRYPVWQFDGAGVLPGFEEALAALTVNDPLTAMRFFLAPSERLGEKRPLDLLRGGNTDAVIEAARVFGHHGAS